MATEQPKNHFTVGINDDVTHTSLPFDRNFSVESPEMVRALFYGLGSDGTVGANKNSIKIIGEETPYYAQGYFHYDSKKAGTVTTSHLRFGPKPIRLPYLIDAANFVACHQWSFIERYDMLANAVLARPSCSTASTGRRGLDHLPINVQQTIIDKKLKLYVIDAYKVAADTGMGVRINTIMQTCFFAISGVLPPDEAIAQIKKAIKKTYGKRGDVVVQSNYAAVDHTLTHLHPVEYPSAITSTIESASVVPSAHPISFGTSQPRSLPAMRVATSVSISTDGTWPTGTQSGRSAISPSRSRCGIPTSVSSAANAPSSARTLPFERRCTIPRSSRTHPKPSNRRITRVVSSPAGSSPFR